MAGTGSYSGSSGSPSVLSTGGCTARISISCSPAARRGITNGDSHGTGSAPSRLQVNVTPSCASLEWKVNSARPLSASTSGAESMNVSGAVRSPIRHSYSTHCSSQMPWGSRARTAKKCSPLDRFVYSTPELQFSSSTPSSQHQKVEPGTSAAQVNFALVLSVISPGAVRIEVIGGAATVHS